MKGRFPDRRHLAILGAMSATEPRTVADMKGHHTGRPGWPPGARNILPHLQSRGLVAGGPTRWTITPEGAALLAEHP